MKNAINKFLLSDTKYPPINLYVMPVLVSHQPDKVDHSTFEEDQNNDDDLSWLDNGLYP